MAKAKTKTERIQIKPVNNKVISVPIIGLTPLVQHKFSEKARKEILDKQTSTAKKTKKPPRDIEQEFKDAQHISEDGWNGIPASAFRSAMVSACRLVGFKMTLAKLTVFVIEDGQDSDEYGLVKLIAGPPRMAKDPVRLESGVCSIAIRPRWKEWAAIVTLKYDADQFTADDVVNLLDRAGQQVGIGEGRPDSKKSVGVGWGTFQVDLDAMKQSKKKGKGKKK
jgi:hypothetical protein